MRDQGWHCPDSLPGPLSLVDARRGGGEDGRIVHLSYTDGLATVSVFEQRGRLDAADLDGYRRDVVDGHEVWVQRRRAADGWSGPPDSTVYTVVADAPERTVDAGGRGPAAPTRLRTATPSGRLGRGLDRVASWFNPFR